MAVCAHLSFPLPYSPVPVTMQTFGVLLIGMLLGPGASFAALTLYLAEGAIGLPVFAPLGAPGILHLLGPTAGFLLAYPLAACAAGALFQRLQDAIGSFLAAICAGTAGLIPIFAIGAGWLAVSLHQSISSAVVLAVAPFLVGEVLKLLLVAGIIASLQHSRTAA